MVGPVNGYHGLERLSIDRLEKVLDAAVNTEPEKGDFVDAVLKVMAEKEKKEPTGRISDVEKAWKEFKAR